MSILLVTHPHSFDKGKIRDDLINFLHSTPIESYCIPDGDKEIYGGKQAYNGVLKPNRNLGKVGRASLTHKDANKIVRNNRKIYLAGGYLSECLASTYNSIVRAAERLNQPVKAVFIKDLIYVKAERQTKVVNMDYFIANVNSEKEAKKRVSTLKESKNVKNSYTVAWKLINKQKTRKTSKGT